VKDADHEARDSHNGSQEKEHVDLQSLLTLRVEFGVLSHVKHPSCGARRLTRVTNSNHTACLNLVNQGNRRVTRLPGSCSEIEESAPRERGPHESFCWSLRITQYSSLVEVPPSNGKRNPVPGGTEEEAMTINDLPTIMGTVLIIAGLALVGIYTRFRTEGSEKSVQAGALLIVVGAVLLGLSLFVPHAK
jgi:hypothetical protein